MLCFSRQRSFTTGRRFLKEVRPELAGIQGTTMHYLDGDFSFNENKERARKFKSVKSSNALLSMSEPQGRARKKHLRGETQQQPDTATPPTATCPIISFFLILHFL